MIIIHIGSPKTGTTALQGFLKTNADALAARNVFFVRSGRSNIAHNSMVRPLVKGRARDTLDNIAQEILEQPSGIHLLSSEVFFQRGVARPLSDGLKVTGQSIKIIGYLRRPDLYAEAMYKQRVKNGRIARDPDAFLDGWRANLRYMPILQEFSDAFGADALRIRPFRRDVFANRNVISDFASCMGDVKFDDLIDPKASANPTLSRAVSEHLGRVARATDLNIRVMVREISARNAVGTIRSSDVYDKATRLSIISECSDDLNQVSERFIADLDDPFHMADLHDATDKFPSVEERVQLEQAAADAVMDAVARQSGTGDL